MGSDGCERCNQWRKKGRDVPGEEEKQHPSLGDGGGALSEVAGMARRPKPGKNWRCRARGGLPEGEKAKTAPNEPGEVSEVAGKGATRRHEPARG